MSFTLKTCVQRTIPHKMHFFYFTFFFSASSWIFFCFKFQHHFFIWRLPSNRRYIEVHLQQIQIQCLLEKSSDEFLEENEETKDAPGTQLATTNFQINEGRDLLRRIDYSLNNSEEPFKKYITLAMTFVLFCNVLPTSY